jgi:hypothetical protein
MSISIPIPERELYNSESNSFIDIPKCTLVLEHSLISISKWESKWHKSYLSTPKKTKEEEIDYVRCMTINSNIRPEAYYALTKHDWKRIESYLNDPMTATTIKNNQPKFNRDIITSELIYYWMCELGIPFEPCEKWHINRLLMLIEVCSIKRQKPKNMSPAAVMRQNHALNAARRAKHHTRG